MDDAPQPRHQPGSHSGLTCASHGTPLVYYLEQRYPDGPWEHLYICVIGHVCGRELAKQGMEQLALFEEQVF